MAAHRLPKWSLPRLLIVLLLALLLLAARSAHAQETSPKWQVFDGPGGRLTLLAGSRDGRELYAVSEVGVNRQGDQTQWRDTGVPTDSNALYASRDAWRDLATGHKSPASRLDYRAQCRSGGPVVGRRAGAR